MFCFVFFQNNCCYSSLLPPLFVILYPWLQLNFSHFSFPTSVASVSSYPPLYVSCFSVYKNCDSQYIILLCRLNEKENIHSFIQLLKYDKDLMMLSSSCWCCFFSSSTALKTNITLIEWFSVCGTLQNFEELPWVK